VDTGSAQENATNKKVEAMSWEFLVTSLIVIASPGTGALFTLAAGLSRGSRASVVAAFGCTLGIIPRSSSSPSCRSSWPPTRRAR
jgi:hypothetical protein